MDDISVGQENTKSAEKEKLPEKKDILEGKRRDYRWLLGIGVVLLVILTGGFLFRRKKK